MSKKEKTILLVMDDAAGASLSDTLKNGGFDVVPAGSRSAALDLCRSGLAVDLVVIDIDPDTGTEGADTAASILTERDTPVLFLMSHTGPETVRKIEGIAHYGIVDKKSSLDLILASLMTAIRLHRTGATTRNHEELLTKALTDNLKSEESRRDIQERYQRLFEQTMDSVYIHDLHGNFIDANDSALRLLGYKREDIPTLNFASLLDREQIPKAIASLKEMTTTGRQLKPNEYYIMKKDGSVVYVETLGSTLYRDGMPYAVIALARDITERRRTEEALRESEKRYRTLFEGAMEGIFIMDFEGTLIDANESFAQMHGYSTGELRSMKLSDLDSEETSWLAPERMKMIMSGEALRFEVEHFHRDGHLFPLSVSANRLDIDGTPYVLGMHFDITEQKAAAEALSAALKEKEALLRELQHRVKNSFSIVIGILELEKRRHKDSAIEGPLTNISNRIGSMSDLYDLLHHSRQINEIQLDQYLGRMCNTLVTTYAQKPDQIELDTRLEGITLDMKRALSLGLIVNELITNAVKYAFPRGIRGTIRIELVKTKDAITLVVADNGTGMPKKTAGKKSQGVGLELVNMLVLQLKGKISRRTAGGTIYKITIPASR